MAQPKSTRGQGERVRVLLVDDSPEFLESAARFLSTDPWIEIVGRALSGSDALAQAARLHPDLVLMDLAMPGMNGLEAARQIRTQPDPPRIVIVTMYDSPEYRVAAEAEGAEGFVTKPEFGTRLLPLIRTLFVKREA